MVFLRRRLQQVLVVHANRHLVIHVGELDVQRTLHGRRECGGLFTQAIAVVRLVDQLDGAGRKLGDEGVAVLR